MSEATVGPDSTAHRAVLTLESVVRARAADESGYDGRIGRELLLLDSVDSTNRVAAEQARSGAAEGLTVIAHTQHSGRGRLSRRWESPPGAGLTLSVVLRPSLGPGEWPWIGLMAAVAVAETLDLVGLGGVAVKWPNDVLADGQKIAGLLNERVETPEGPALVLGIGLNVDQVAEELPMATATSIRLATGERFERAALLVVLLERLAEGYRRAQRPEDRRAAYLDRCATIGQLVRVELPTEPALVGEAVGVDSAGRVLIEVAGQVRAISAGDVVHVRPAR